MSKYKQIQSSADQSVFKHVSSRFYTIFATVVLAGLGPDAQFAFILRVMLRASTLHIGHKVHEIAAG
jgi:hypothetical protein